MKKSFLGGILCVVMLTVLIGQGFAVEIEEALVEKLNAVQRTDETVKVVLIMKDKLPALNMRTPGSRDNVIRHLRSQSDRSQRDVLDFINLSSSKWGPESNVRVRPFWLANYVVVEGPLSLVSKLTSNESIEKIVLEKSL
ncbi:MAG: hypothetical protein QGH40_10150, partial [bacterium]|nr:hypothetical protein [bacterium]